MGHLDYNKLVDTVFVVGRNLVLRMNVGLYETNANGERIFYHKEYRYKAKHETRYSLFRNFSYFLTLENTKSCFCEVCGFAGFAACGVYISRLIKDRA